MRTGLFGLILGVVAALAVSPVSLAQTAAPSSGAKATPDLSGIWVRVGAGQIYDEVKEPPSMTPWAEALFKANRQGVTNPTEQGIDEMDPENYCFPMGTPRAYLPNYPVEIVQLPNRLYFLHENTHLVRRIYLDGRKIPDGYPPSFMGYSTGKWDGDTLVVETVGFNDLTWLDALGHPHSDALRITERIRRVSADTLDFQFDDSKAYTKPWTGKKTFRLRNDWEIMEHNGFCEDRNRDEFRRKVLLGTTEWKTPGK